ncbi:MAG TPA: hypothetical protein VFA56_06925 [Gaiellaceae bacterium]|nr:hypothetical protein [Gaiellaceae bacterium]
MTRGGLAGAALLGAAVLVGGAAGAVTGPAARTEACLERLPGAVRGLPPATPPAGRVVFVYRAPRGRLVAPMQAQMGAWRGRGRTYEGVMLSFFATPRAARTFVRASGAGTLVGSVVVEPDRASTAWQAAVRACLTAPGDGAAPIRTAPKASLATFAGGWGGHTRGLRIAASGSGSAFADDGCCVRLYELSFRIVSVRGTITRATAVYRVTASKHYSGGPTLRPGQRGELRLRNGIVTNTLTRDSFCSDPAWGATGACGA